MPEVKVYLADELRTGMQVSYERDISEEDVLSFAGLTGDFNPLHVDQNYAATTNYQRRIVHGAFQVGLASAALGMHLPGQNVLLGSINSRFPTPLYFPSKVRVSGEITSWNLDARSGQLKVLIQEANGLETTAEIYMGFTLHERGRGQDAGGVFREQKNHQTTEQEDGLKVVIVTGASGGLGADILAALAPEYRVVGVINKQPLDEKLKSLPNVSELKLDLSATDLEKQLLDLVGSRPVYGIVHAAWPGAPRGGLLHADEALIRTQLDFGTVVAIRLARFLFGCAGPEGGRFIALGSTAGTFKPYLPLGAYSLGKACLENTLRLLAPELARKKITINAVCPSFIATGINKRANERQILMESAGIPLGRVCVPEDVVGMVSYFLSPSSSFVSGQVIALNGAQL
jgi:NAD(P)-dependent dehydrogenase (short-subunit alcohol dehydrogenase family)/acyl dehydratase